MSADEQSVEVEGRRLKLTNLSRVLWPRQKITKAELIKYYAEVGPYMISFIRDRPLMAQRYPEGINAEYFVQKHFTAIPPWVRRLKIAPHKSDFILCNELATLIWLANLAAIEINHTLGGSPNISKPDVVLIDLDPHRPAGFKDAQRIARGVATLLDELELSYLLKTSGADGIHFFIPIIPKYSFEKIRKFVYAIGKLIEKVSPEITTVSTRADRKRGHVYIDFLQNALEKTITAPFSARALPDASVSFPISTSQLEDPKLSPAKFTVRNAASQLRGVKKMVPLASVRQNLDSAFRRVGLRP